jgi:hypothetical protein
MKKHFLTAFNSVQWRFVNINLVAGINTSRDLPSGKIYLSGKGMKSV